MGSSECVLMAAGLDWLEGLLPIVFVLIWIISQVLNLFRGAAKKAADGPNQPLRPPPPVRRGAGQAAAGRDDGLNLEVEEFLRRTRPPAKSPPHVPKQAGKPVRKRKPERPAMTVRPLPSGGPTASAVGGTPQPKTDGGDIARHVASAFAHDLVHESPDLIGSGLLAKEAAAATALIAALQSPGGLRQSILMLEILERPTHRW